MPNDVKCECGHLASEHYGADSHGICLGAPALSCSCRLNPVGVYRSALAEHRAACERLRCDAQGFHDIIMKDALELRRLRAELGDQTAELTRLREDNTYLRAEKASIWSTINSPEEQP